MSPIIVQLSSSSTKADHTAPYIHEDSYGKPEIVEDKSRDSLQDLSSFTQESYDLNNHNNSSSPSTLSPSNQSTMSLLPVHSPSQLEVLLPISYPLVDSTEQSVHSMVTRLKSGTIPRRSYIGFIASSPELQTLKIDDECDFNGGFLLLLQSRIWMSPLHFEKPLEFLNGKMQCKKSSMH
ncbi:hypothetical protein ACFX1Q_043252 [Malus domestica]